MNAMTNPVNCMERCHARSEKRPRHGARLRRRALVAAVAAALLATIVYGESWLLEAPANTCVECAVTTSVARALDGDTATP
jgi:hypothetical protein